MIDKTRLLFLIILVEGYVVLACELLAIRQLIPFVGSGTETVSIVISAVLLPLAVGYHFGGSSFKKKYARAKSADKAKVSVRKILLRNIITSLFILSFGLSYAFMEFFFDIMSIVGIKNRLFQTAIYSLIFLVTPVFLLGQTVPLISNYFSRRRLSEITGMMLFFSTAGSFLGSVFSTIVLMMTIGVHNTVIFTMLLLFMLVLLLSRRIYSYEIWAGAFVIFVLYSVNNSAVMEKFGIVSDNAYNTVMIRENPDKGTKTMVLNRSNSSEIDKDGNSTFPYIQYFERNFIKPLEMMKVPHEILIIGAGGFTAGASDKVNNYTYVDIDKALKDVAEKHYLPSPLPANKKFVAASARAFVRADKNKYDLILIDTYTNLISIPMETVTREFLLDTKNLLKENGVLVANVITSPSFRDKFSVRYDNSFASVFPSYSRQIVGDFVPWAQVRNVYGKTMGLRNVLYIYFNTPLSDDSGIYTDDKNTFSIDRN